MSVPSSEQLDVLWNKVISDPYPKGSLPTRVPGAWARRKLFRVGFNRGSFELSGDELPPDRPKLVHTWGTCARVRMKIDDAHGFTGVLESGGEALLRFSDANGGARFLPSLALKFMIQGHSSLNLLALPMSYREKGDRHPMSSVFSNGTQPARELDAKLVQRAFQKTADALGGTRLYAVYLPLHHLAARHTDGRVVSSPVVADRVEFHPAAEARAASDGGKDFREALAQIPKGTKLFDLKVSDHLEKPAVPLGELWLESEWVASRFGDERLFFAHDVGPTGTKGH